MTSDPFKILNEDVHQNILQHLDGNEIKKLSLVSKSWHQIIGSSRECMRKIICRVDKQMHLDILKQSTRHYENFKVTPYQFVHQLTVTLEDFCIKNMWLNEICDKEINHSGYVELIKSFSRSVEFLQIGDIATKNYSNRSAIIVNFPKLKKLHCSFTNRAAFSILLGNNPHLETVILSSDLLTTDDNEFLHHDNVIVKFLAKNYQIKNLWLLNLEKLFFYDISSKVGHLKHFTFTTNFHNLPADARDNFIKFLKWQGNFDSLNMMGCRDKRTLLEIWNSSIKFKKLFIIDCNFYEELCTLDLQKNLFVKDIDFYLTSSLHALIFLQNSPNITQYKVRQLSKQLLEFSLRHLKYLKCVKYQSIDMDARKFYNEYKATIQNDNLSLVLKELDFFEYLNIDKKMTERKC